MANNKLILRLKSVFKRKKRSSQPVEKIKKEIVREFEDPIFEVTDKNS